MLGSLAKSVDLIAIAHAETEPEILFSARVVAEVVGRHVHAVDCLAEIFDGATIIDHSGSDGLPLRAFARWLREHPRMLGAIVLKNSENVFRPIAVDFDAMRRSRQWG